MSNIDRRKVLASGVAAIPCWSFVRHLAFRPSLPACLPIIARGLKATVARRQAAPTGRNVFCIFETAPVYVQALAPRATSSLVLEAVSEHSVPDWHDFAGNDGHAKLRRLGFAPPGEGSPNYRQEFGISSNHDVDLAAVVLARALADVFGVDRVDRLIESPPTRLAELDC